MTGSKLQLSAGPLMIEQGSGVVGFRPGHGDLRGGQLQEGGQLHLEARLCQEERFLRRPFLFGRDLDAFGYVEQLIIGLRYLEADLLSQTVAERCGGIRSAGRT